MLPSLFSDHAVLQQQTEVPVWGWAAAGSPVEIAFRNKVIRTTAGNDERWEATIFSGEPGGPFEMIITTSQGRQTLRDLLVGEVLIAGGQSNMWWAVEKCFDFETHQAAATDAWIRIFDTNTHPTGSGWLADTPQRTVDARWVVASPEEVGRFPSTAYFCARTLRETLGVPVGILHFAVPGSAIQPHIEREFGNARFPHLMEQAREAATRYPERLARYETERIPAWETQAAEARATGAPPPKRPGPPRKPHQLAFGGFFDAMLHPCVPYSARACIWWQGEGNQADFSDYRALFPALIENWRTAWRSPTLPFVYVELANIGPPQVRPVEEASFPAVRDAQRRALALPHVHGVSALDVKRESEPVWEIHPKDKQKVGERLAATLLAALYQVAPLPATGPLFRRATFEGSTGRVQFEAAAGLSPADGTELRGFAVAGPDRLWHWADRAEIAGDTVLVECRAVPELVAVRYAWANAPVGNLINASHQPAMAFRSDDWPIPVKEAAVD